MIPQNTRDTASYSVLENVGVTTRGFVCACIYVHTCTSHTYRYDIVIVSRYLTETKYVHMRTNLAGSVVVRSTCLSNKLCTV